MLFLANYSSTIENISECRKQRVQFRRSLANRIGASSGHSNSNSNLIGNALHKIKIVSFQIPKCREQLGIPDGWTSRR